MDSALGKETLFFDYMQDIINHCLNKNFADAEGDFNDLESMINNESCLPIVQDAKSAFYSVKNNADYKNSFSTLKERLLTAYKNYIKN